MKKTFALSIVSIFLFAVSVFAATPMKEALVPFVESGEFPGMVVVTASPDEILSVDAVGWADREKKKPMTEDTMFWMASMTKAVVGCCAAILIDEGKLDIDAPITYYIPEFKDLQVYRHEKDEELFDLRIGQIKSVEELKQPLTVRHCLTHTAGWRFLSPMQKAPVNPFTAEQDAKTFGFPPVNITCLSHQKAIASYAMMGLDFQPGEKYSYSNIGINVAAAVIERIYGKPIEVMMQERIFDPLGMTETTFWPDEEQMERMATPYNYDQNSKKQIPLPHLLILGYPYNDRLNRFAEGGGGLFSTAPDFVKFYQMLAGHGTYQGKQVISENAWKIMTTKQTPDNIEKAYGFGLEVGDDGYSHGGAAGTFGAVYNNGLVTVYAVQLLNFPEQGKPQSKFDEAAKKFFAEKTDK